MPFIPGTQLKRAHILAMIARAGFSDVTNTQGPDVLIAIQDADNNVTIYGDYASARDDIIRKLLIMRVMNEV